MTFVDRWGVAGETIDYILWLSKSGNLFAKDSYFFCDSNRLCRQPRIEQFSACILSSLLLMQIGSEV